MDRNHGLTVKSALIVMMSVLAPVIVIAADLQPDAVISKQVNSALQSAKGVRVSAVLIETVNGSVTLHGNVQSEKDRTRAAETARSVAGVVAVRNLLQVVARSEMGRVTTSTSTKHAVRTAPPPASPPNAVRVAPVIAGRRALLPASGPKDLVVPLEAVAADQHESVDATDEVIRQGVELALENLDARDNENVHVDVKDGIVQLTGTVSTTEGDASRLVAARSVTGVRSVISSLRLVPLNADAQ